MTSASPSESAAPIGDWTALCEFPAETAEARGFHAALRTIANSLERLPAEDSDLPRESMLEILGRREATLHEQLSEFYKSSVRQLAIDDLQRRNAFETIHTHALLIDSILKFAFDTTLDELPWHVRLQRHNAEQELAFNESLLPQKEDKLTQLETLLQQQEGQTADEDDPEREYYANVRQTLQRELQDVREIVGRLRSELPVLAKFSLDKGAFLEKIVLFARGGYGRGELTFASDLDNGYCLDIRTLSGGEVAIYREWIMRLEALLAKSGIETQHQYFEIGEDLTRFTLPETVHTITSVFEARPLIGNPKLLSALKTEFWDVFPFDVFLEDKLSAYPGGRAVPLTTQDMKNGPGGMRNVQIPLWILGVFNLADNFNTSNLLRLGEESGALSPNEAVRLARALEWIMELRNFVGGAERFYYDKAAKASNIDISAFTPNIFNDALARLYLLRKQRFGSLDALDSYRLQLMNDARDVSRRLLERVLDRTFEQEIAPNIQAEIHRGRKQIISLKASAGAKKRQLRELFPDGRSLLNLLKFVAQSGYGLSDEIIDELGGMVSQALPANERSLAGEEAEIFSQMIAAPHLNLAVESMFRISDAGAPDIPSLMGRFIPEYDALRYMLRKQDQRTVVIHEQLINAVAEGEQVIQSFRTAYPEYFSLLEPIHIRAVKWSLLLHALGYLDIAAPDPSKTAEMAVEALGRLGVDDEGLVNIVRLLVQHCRAVSTLSRTAAYGDQALARFFEIADRNFINVILLYLVNLAIVRAVGSGGGRINENQSALLRNFFREAEQILSAMRGVFDEDRALSLINEYFDQKKSDLMEDTRAFLVYQKALTVGINVALFQPIAANYPDDWQRIKRAQGEINGLYRKIVLGTSEPSERKQNTSRFVQLIRNNIPPRIIHTLTAERKGLFDWFFASAPNRYLLSTPPMALAENLADFAEFRSRSVIVDLVGEGTNSVEGLLISTVDLNRSHMRVAYALSNRRINIHSGKINRFELEDGRFGFCYYFQISYLDHGTSLDPREFEKLIRDGAPPELSEQEYPSSFPYRGTRVEYLGEDDKSYLIKEIDQGFVRKPTDFSGIRVVFRDEPFLFFRVCRAFDLYDVEISQALITTTGQQVVDHFYVGPEDYKRLFAANFEETLIRMAGASL